VSEQEIAQLKQRLAEAEKALEFYAEEVNRLVSNFKDRTKNETP